MPNSPRRSRPVGPVAIIGLGAFGGTVAADLAGFGHHVIGIDIDERQVDALSETVAQALIADARDERALKDAGVDQCDAVIIAMGEDLEANIVGAMNARVLGVGQIWVKSRTRTHQRILTRIGVDHVINPERDMGHRVAQMIHNPFVTDYMTAAGNLTVVSLSAPESLRGKSLDEVDFSGLHGIECLGSVRKGRLARPGDGATIEPGDMLLLLGKRSDLQRFGEITCT